MIWNQHPLESDDFTIEMEFKIEGQEKASGKGIGLMLSFIPPSDLATGGPIFGLSEFQGTLIVFDIENTSTNPKEEVEYLCAIKLFPKLTSIEYGSWRKVR